jgi:hypothetical protein
MPLDFVFKFVVTVLFASLIHQVGFVIAGKLLSIPLNQFTLFYGPRLFRRNIRGVDFSICLLPLGNSVEFVPEALERAGRTRKAILLLSGCTLTFLVAVVCRGFETAATSTLNGFSQIVEGAVSRKESGSLLAGLAALSSSRPWTTFFGIVAAKYCAANLLPAPGLNGGQFLLTVLHLDSEKPPKLLQPILILSFMLAMFIFFAWIFSLATYLLGNS